VTPTRICDMDKLPTSFIVNPLAAHNVRYGCVVCRWRSDFGFAAISQGLEHAAVHENEPNAEMFLEASRFMMKLLDHGDNLDDFGCVLSKRGDEGWNSSVLEQMEDSGVLVRVRGMG